MKRLTFLLTIILVGYLVYDYFKKKSGTKTTTTTQPETIVIYNVVNDSITKEEQRIVELESQYEITALADNSVNYGQVVCIKNGHCMIYDPLNTDNYDLPIGLCKQYGYAGSKVKIQVAGIFSGLSGLSLGEYYAGENGSITHNVPTQGQLRSIGFPVSEQSIKLEFSKNIIL